MNIDKIKEEIFNISKQIDKLKDQRLNKVKELIDNCDHPKEEIFEIYFSNLNRPPYKICRKCGLSEEGWGVGYQIFGNDEVPIVKEEFYHKYLKATKYQNSDERYFEY